LILRPIEISFPKPSLRSPSGSLHQGLQLAFLESCSLCYAVVKVRLRPSPEDDTELSAQFNSDFPVTLPLPLLTFSVRIQLAISVAFFQALSSLIDLE